MPPITPELDSFRNAFMSLPQLYAQPKEEDWLIADVLNKGEIMMIFGDSGSGKSYIAIDLLMALATGTPWCGGRFTVPKPRHVLFCAGEGMRGVRHRFYAREQLYRDEDPEGSPSVLVLPTVPQIFDRDSEESADRFVQSYLSQGYPPVDAMVIDTLNRCTLGGNENDTRDASLMVAGMDYLSKHLGCAVIIIHHTNRGDDYRGNTALRAGMNVMLKIKRRTYNSHVLICNKMKDGDTFEDIAFHFMKRENSSVISWDGRAQTKVGALSEAILQLFAENPGARLSASQIAEHVDATSSNTSKCLRETLSGRFESGLLDPSMEPNRRTNPVVYYPR